MDLYIENAGMYIGKCLYRERFYIFSFFFKKVLDIFFCYLYTNKSVEEHNTWDLSSAGRASALQAEGHRFEPYRSHFYGGIAQLARAYGSYP